MEETVDPAVGVAVGDGFECGLEKSEGPAAVDLRGFDERGDPAPGFPALVVACEQGIFSVQSDWPDQVLDTLGANLDPALVKEGLPTST